MAMIMLAHSFRVIRRRIAIGLLERGEYIAGEVAKGEDVFEMYRKIKPNLLIMEMLMSGMNGIECLRVIRAYYPSAQILIIYDGKYRELCDAALAEGCSGIIRNPYDIQKVYQAIQSILRKQPFWQMVKSEMRCATRLLSDTE
ncbi:MAG: response regulator [Lachnospiraceae bacterium]|nr:response regulator [Lachnospiraceae bacterium]